MTQPRGQSRAEEDPKGAPVSPKPRRTTPKRSDSPEIRPSDAETASHTRTYTETTGKPGLRKARKRTGTN